MCRAQGIQHGREVDRLCATAPATGASMPAAANIIPTTLSSMLPTVRRLSIRTYRRSRRAVCADSIGFRIYSGIGGQMDFVRGATRSPGGKAVSALPSTAANGGVSRIVPALARGAGVVTTRGHIHWVVTEFGAVDLFGKSLRQRAELLISIAHPDFRAELHRAFAETRHVVPRDPTGT
jgi:Acetyl-CoA hydrolase/transferase C-terminal domain